MRAIDIMHGATHDLCEPAVLQSLLSSIQLRAFDYVHCAPPCSSFSLARWPPVRSRARPQGLQGLSALDQAKVVTGNKLAAATVRLLLAARAGGVAASIEQPQTS